MVLCSVSKWSELELFSYQMELLLLDGTNQSICSGLDAFKYQSVIRDRNKNIDYPHSPESLQRNYHAHYLYARTFLMFLIFHLCMISIETSLEI